MKNLRSLINLSYILPNINMTQKSITSYFTSPSKTKAGSSSGNNTNASKNMATTAAKEGSANTLYDPSKDSYHPVKNAIWKKGEKTPYFAFAKTMERVEDESSRLAMIQTTCNFFRSVILLSPDDLTRCLYLCLNKIAPAWEGIELNVGPSIIEKAVAESTGRSGPELKKLVKDQGDMGKVAEACRNTQRTLSKPTDLTVEKVFLEFKKISTISGNASQTKKIGIITGLLASSKPVEAKFIVRALGAKMRTGLAEQSVLGALAHAAALVVGDRIEMEKGEKTVKPSEEKLKLAVGILKRAYNEYPNYDVMIKALVEGGLSNVKDICHIRPGVPVKPMLAHPAKSIDLLLEKLGDHTFVSEYKYDGERAQIHMEENGTISIYSRNQEDHTKKYPEVVKRLPTHAKKGVTSFILDAEVVAWDRVEGHILPFQDLSKRKRKDVDNDNLQVQVCLHAFDLLYFNGNSLISEPLNKRQEMLYENFEITKDELMFATRLVSSDSEELSAFLAEAIQNRCEGLMVKASDGPYEISKRSNNWFKLKKDYLDNVGDSVDVVVIGAFDGKGKRVGTYGSYLCAVYNPKTAEFQTLCKLATGFSDEKLDAFTKELQPLVIPKPHKMYRYSQSPKDMPNVWFEPMIVWEIKGADLSISPVHTAASGLEDSVKGISLRFPRFIKVRKDKKPEDATDGAQIVNMYRQQATVQKSPKKASAEDSDDDY